VHLGWEVEVELSLKDGQEVKAYLTRSSSINSCNPSLSNLEKQRLSHQLLIEGVRETTLLSVGLDALCVDARASPYNFSSITTEAVGLNL